MVVALKQFCDRCDQHIPDGEKVWTLQGFVKGSAQDLQHAQEMEVMGKKYPVFRETEPKPQAYTVLLSRDLCESCFNFIAEFTLRTPDAS